MSLVSWAQVEVPAAYVPIQVLLRLALALAKFHGMVVGGRGFFALPLRKLPTLLLRYPAVDAGSENLAIVLPNWKHGVPERISAAGSGRHSVFPKLWFSGL